MKDLYFTIEVIDFPSKRYIHVDYRGAALKIERFENGSSDSELDIVSRSEILAYALESDWGGDCITIGYGIQAYIKNKRVLEGSIALYAVGLLTRHPNERSHILKKPMRSLQFIASNEIHRDFFLSKILRKRTNLREKLYSNSSTYSQDQWLNKDKCEICKICGIPDLEADYFE